MASLKGLTGSFRQQEEKRVDMYFINIIYLIAGKLNFQLPT